VHKFRHSHRSTRVMCWNACFTKFSEITQYNGHYAIQGHRYWKLIHDFLLVINTNTSYLAPFPSYGWLFVKLSLARRSAYLYRYHLGWSPVNIAINNISLKTTLIGLHLCRRKYPCIFAHYYANKRNPPRKVPNSDKLYAAVRPITPFKVIQGHRVWYQSKAYMWLPISD